MHTQKLQKSRRITNELIDEVCRYIRVGTPILTSGKAAGISSRDFQLWMKEGSSDFHSMACINCDYALFYEVITKEEARMHASLFNNLNDAALNGKVEASIWLLEYHGFSNQEPKDSFRNENETLEKMTPAERGEMERSLEEKIQLILSRRKQKSS